VLGWSLMFIVALILIIILLAGVYGISFGTEDVFMSGWLTDEALDETDSETASIFFPLLILFIYIPFIFGQKGFNDAYFSNYVRHHTTLYTASFRGNLNIFKMAWISISNVVAMLLSLGLLYPWAKVRYLKYKLGQTSFACNDYNQFISYGYERGSTVGEEMMDFFDINIGL